jgi:RNA polymerase sigma-70 factor (ECF subfamily)
VDRAARLARGVPFMDRAVVSRLDVAHELTAGFGGHYIRRKARQLVGVAGLTAADCPDIEQELALAVVERVASFDPKRAHWNVFVVTIVERCAASLLRLRRRAKRSCHIVILCDAQWGNHESARWSHDPSNAIDLRHDLAVTVAALPREQRYLCYRLQFESVSEMSRKVRLSRTTIYKFIQKIRRALVRNGFGNP